MAYAALKRRSSTAAPGAGRVKIPTSGAEARNQGMDLAQRWTSAPPKNRCATQNRHFSANWEALYHEKSLSKECTYRGAESGCV